MKIPNAFDHFCVSTCVSTRAGVGMFVHVCIHEIYKCAVVGRGTPPRVGIYHTGFWVLNSAHQVGSNGLYLESYDRRLDSFTLLGVGSDKDGV